MAERRTIGSDAGSYTGVRQLNEATKQEDLRGYEALSKGNQFFAQLSQQTTDSFIEANKSVANSRAAQYQAEANAAAKTPLLSDLAEGIASAIGVVEKSQQERLRQELKMQEEQEKALGDIADAEAAKRTAVWKAKVNEYLLTDPKGTTGLMEEYDADLSSVPHLRAADKAKYISSLGATSEAVDFSNFTRYIKGVEDVKTEQYELVKIEQQGKLAPVLASMQQLAKGLPVTDENGKPETFESLQAKGNEIVAQSFSKLSVDDLLSQLKLQKDFYSRVAETVIGDTELKSKAAIEAFGIQQVLDYAASIQEKFAGDLNGYRAAVGSFGRKFGFDFNFSVDLTDQNRQREWLRNKVEDDAAIQDAREKGLIDNLKSWEMSNKSSAFWALTYYNNPAALEQIEKDAVRRPEYANAIEYAKLIKEIKEGSSKVAGQNASLLEKKAALRAANARWLAGKFEPDNEQKLLATLQSGENLPSGVQDNLLGLASGLQSVLASGNPVEQEKWMKENQAALTDQLAAIDKQIDANSSSYEDKRQQASTLGLMDKNGNFYDAKTLKQYYDKDMADLNKRITTFDAEWKARYTPSFNQGSGTISNVPAVYNHKETGQRVALPFRAVDQSKLNIGRGIGNGHKGLDIAVQVNTPLINLVDGVVIDDDKSSPDPNGYGQYLKIRDSATGQIHIFGHLNNRWFQKGDRVSAGQFIGKTGGAVGDPRSGRSTGPHLHWEVRDANGNPIYHSMAEPSGGFKPLESKPSRSRNSVSRNTTSHLKLGNKDAKGNYKSDNYGYQGAAKHGVKFNQALHKLADELQVPAIWLYDMIGGIETTHFDPSESNGVPGHDCVGLIQLCPDKPGVRYKTLPGIGKVDLEKVRRMTPLQQIPLIRAYMMGAKGKMTSFLDLWGHVRWGSVEEGRRKVKARDGLGSDWYKDQERLRSRSGRTYTLPGKESRRARANAIIHEQPVAACRFCQQQTAANFTIHEGVG